MHSLERILFVLEDFEISFCLLKNNFYNLDNDAILQGELIVSKMLAFC
jgi:hypothetical protein